MHFAFTEEQLAFRDAVREALARACPPAVVRAAWDASAGADLPLKAWPALAEMGVIGMTAPERWGGLGLDELDLAPILEEAGRAALPEPLLETTAVAIPLLAELGDDTDRDRWLGAAAAGRAILAVQLGGAPFALDAARAAVVFVERGDEVHAIERGRATLIAEPSVDRGRKLYHLDWNPGADTLLAGGARARRALDLAFDRGAAGAAAQLCGIAAHLIEVTCEYVKVRTQFGKPVGSFQAVKHHLAGALVALELARPCAYRAAYAIARREPERALHVSLAKARASEAAQIAARAALQCHGAIGYSFEYDLHMWMKRAWALAAAWGDAAWHRERIAAIVIDQRGEQHA